jgi:hypothetical protein
MLSSKRAPLSTSSPVSMYAPTMRRVSRMPTCGAISAISARSKPGTSARRKRMYSTIWRRPSTSAALSWRASVASTASLGVGQLGDVGAPLAGVALRPQDGAAARKAVAAGGRSISASMALNSPMAACARSASTLPMRNMVLGYSALAGAVAQLIGHAGEVRQVGVARGVDELRARMAGGRSGSPPAARRCAWSPSITTPTASAWNSSCTPAASSQSSAAHL